MGHRGEPWHSARHRRLLRRDELSGGRWGCDERGRDEASAGFGEGESCLRRRKPRVPVSPRAGKPAVHGLAVQAGRLCLQRLAGQREPERGGRRHPRDHEPEPHRWVAGGLGGGTSSALAPGDPGSPRGPTAVGWDGVCGSGMETPPPQPCPGRRRLPKVMGRSSGRARPGQDGRPAGCGASPCSSRNPDPDGAVPERRPHVLYCSISRGNLFPF